MYITKQQLDERLVQTEILVRHKERKEGGRGKALDHEDRVMIGVMAGIMPQKDVAEIAGVSESTVSDLSKGMTSHVLGVDQELKADIEEGLEEKKAAKLKKMDLIKDQLITNLTAAIAHVGNNLSGTDANEASKIAVDMSKILDKVNGSPGRQEIGPRVSIVINAPAMREEKHYQVVEA
jgi:hypothetical protein